MRPTVELLNKELSVREEVQEDQHHTKPSFSMGIKSKAAIAIVVLLVFLGSIWLQGGLDYQWDSCLKGYNHIDTLHRVANSSEADGAEGPPPLKQCPGQKFQLSLLLVHMLEAAAVDSDVLLRPYLASWDELVKFMEALGPMVGLISKEIESKTSIIRQLALLAEQGPEEEAGLGEGTGPWPSEPSEPSDPSAPYYSLRSMIRSELTRGLVDFRQQTDSGCRTLLRLHRALLWLQRFLEKLSAVAPPPGRLRRPSELCREAYQGTLAQHHTWFVRKAAELAFIAMPERGFFYRLVCVQSQEEFSGVLNTVVRAIEEVYDRTQVALREEDMLDLP